MSISDRRKFLKNIGQGSLAAGLMLNLPKLYAEKTASGKAGPDNLVICMVHAHQGEKAWEAIHDKYEDEHTAHMKDLWKRGVFWAGGPTDQGVSIEIFAVESIEECKKVVHNIPMYKCGFLHDDEYLLWHPRHWPPLHANLDPNSGKRTDL